MNILLRGDLADTGFGRVVREMSRRWIEWGHSVRIVAVNWRGRDGEAVVRLQKGHTADEIARWLRAFDADPVHACSIPAGIHGDAMGYNLIEPASRGELWQGWRPDRVVIVADPWALGEALVRSPGLGRSVPAFNYVPIEGTGLPLSWGILWQRVVPVAMSTFGQVQLQGLLDRPVAKVHHGVSEAFYPITPMRPGFFRDETVNSRDEARELLKLDGRLVIMRADRNVSRKNYAALFRSAAPVLRAHPEAVLFLHCAPLDEGGTLAAHVSRLPGAFEVDGSWRHPQVMITGGHDTFTGLDDGALAVLFNTADIYASTSCAEGFGLTLVEAAACAVPVVTTDYAAGPEVVGPGAFLAPPAALFTNTYGFEWALVDEARFAEHLSTLADDPALRVRMGAAGAAHVAQYSWDTAARDFLEIMA